MATAWWGRVRRAVTGRDTAMLPAIVVIHLGLLFKCSVIAVGQPLCASGMCERPPTSIQSAPSSNNSCYSQGQSVVIFCNAGFRENGDRYTALCGERGVWVPDGACRIDLFSVLVACSASLVSILVFFVVVLCMCQYRLPGKRRRQPISKADKKKKEKKNPKADPEAVNGHPAPHHNHHDYQMDDTEDDFTDDEEEILPSKGAKKGHHDEHVYQNEQF